MACVPAWRRPLLLLLLKCRTQQRTFAKILWFSSKNSRQVNWNKRQYPTHDKVKHTATAEIINSNWTAINTVKMAHLTSATTSGQARSQKLSKEEAIPFPSISPPFHSSPFPPFPTEGGPRPLIVTRESGWALKLPSGSGRCPADKRTWPRKRV